MTGRWAMCIFMVLGAVMAACASTAVVVPDPSVPEKDLEVSDVSAPVDGFRLVARFHTFDGWHAQRSFGELVEPAPDGCTHDGLPSSDESTRTAHRAFRRSDPTSARVEVFANTFADTDAATAFMAAVILNARLCSQLSGRAETVDEVDVAEFGLDDESAAAFVLRPSNPDRQHHWVVFRQHESVVLRVAAYFMGDANPVQGADLDQYLHELQRVLEIGRLEPAKGSVFWSERQFELYLIDVYGSEVLDRDDQVHQCFADRVDNHIRWEEDWPSPATQRKNALICDSSIDVSHLDPTRKSALRPPQFERSVPSDRGA